LKPSEEGKEDRWVLLRKSRRILYLIENNVVQPKKMKTSHMRLINIQRNHSDIYVYDYWA